MAKVIMDLPEKGLPRSEWLSTMVELLKTLPEKFLVIKANDQVDWSPENHGWHIYEGKRAQHDTFVTEIALSEQYRNVKVRGRTNAEELKDFLAKFGDIMGFEEVKVSVR